MKLCRHCEKCNAHCARQLCKRCYHTLEIRNLYLPKGKSRSETTNTIAHSLPFEPTQAIQGTEEKIKAMQERVKNKQTLYHPKDARADLN